MTITSAKDLVGRLREFAILVTEKGAAARCSVHLRVQSDGLLGRVRSRSFRPPVGKTHVVG
jgi:hypothetical protein